MLTQNCGVVLEELYKTFNIDHPEDYAARSLSVSDLIVLHDGEATHCYYCDNMIAVCKDGKWGFVDLEGKEIIAPKYKDAKSFSNGLAAVSDGEKWGFIDSAGNLVIDYLFYGGDYFNDEGCCMVETGQGTTWQLISLYIK